MFVFLGFGVGVHESKPGQARQIVVVVVARLSVLWRDCWCCCCQVSGAGVVLQMLFG